MDKEKLGLDELKKDIKDVEEKMELLKKCDMLVKKLEDMKK